MTLVKGEEFMKKLIFKSFVLCAVLVFAASAWAVTIVGGGNDGTNVGSLDELQYETTLLGSPAEEEAWIESQLGFDVTFSFKNDGLTSGDFETTDTAGVYAFALNDEPDYFFVKTGNITDDGNVSFLFFNNPELDWAVINLADMGFTSITNISGVSHISEYDGGTTQVPEPGTLLLLGSGLVGLGFMARKFRA
jgi:hypothetical protein